MTTTDRFQIGKTDRSFTYIKAASEEVKKAARPSQISAILFGRSRTAEWPPKAAISKSDTTMPKPTHFIILFSATSESP